jgi:hypothetical protein
VKISWTRAAHFLGCHLGDGNDASIANLPSALAIYSTSTLTRQLGGVKAAERRLAVVCACRAGGPLSLRSCPWTTSARDRQLTVQLDGESRLPPIPAIGVSSRNWARGRFSAVPTQRRPIRSIAPQRVRGYLRYTYTCASIPCSIRVADDEIGSSLQHASTDVECDAGTTITTSGNPDSTA